MVLVTVGTGIGGGVVVDSRLVRGAFGIAGELGHMRVVPDGIRCGCGNRGCWEVYASGNALVREARELLASGALQAAAIAQACGGDPGALKGADITTLAQSGDPASIELIADLGRWVGEGAASVAAILDPELVVIGGGVVAAGDLLLEPARTAYGRQLTGRGHRPVAPIVAAALGNDAGLIGVAALAAEGVGA
jgi:glucokinase